MCQLRSHCALDRVPQIREMTAGWASTVFDITLNSGFTDNHIGVNYFEMTKHLLSDLSAQSQNSAIILPHEGKRPP